MKKLLIAFGIVAVLVVGAFGGVVAAKPEMQPVDAWNYIVEKVDEIAGMLFDLGGNVTATDAKIDDLSNAVRMETDSRVIEVPAGTDPFDLVEIGGDYDEIRHVVVTLYVYPGTLDTPDTTGTDRISVSAYWPGAPGGWNVAVFDHNSDYKAQTFDFNADYWTIVCESDDASGYTVRLAITTTYVPAPAE